MVFIIKLLMPLIIIFFYPILDLYAHIYIIKKRKRKRKSRSMNDKSLMTDETEESNPT